MGFLGGKKKVDTERSILQIKRNMNELTLSIRRLENRIDEERKKAKNEMAKGNRSGARSHLSIVVDLENRRNRYQQQYLTLETALLNLEEAKGQAEVLKAFKIANEALKSAREMLSPAEIQKELDQLSASFEHISMAGELLSEDISSTGTSLQAEERIEKQLEEMEAEILLEKEGVLPPLEKQKEDAHKEKASEEERIDELLDDLEEEAKKEREAQK